MSSAYVFYDVLTAAAGDVFSTEFISVKVRSAILAKVIVRESVCLYILPKVTHVGFVASPPNRIRVRSLHCLRRGVVRRRRRVCPRLSVRLRLSVRSRRRVCPRLSVRQCLCEHYL